MKTSLHVVLALGALCATEESAVAAVTEWYARPSDVELRRKLTPVQYAVTQQSATGRRSRVVCSTVSTVASLSFIPAEKMTDEVYGKYLLPLGKAKENYLAAGCFWGTDPLRGVLETGGLLITTDRHLLALPLIMTRTY